MKYSTLGIILPLSLYFMSSVKADSGMGYVWGSSIPANGKVVIVDLDGDGRKERVSLIATSQAKNGRTLTYRLKVNTIVLNDVWPESDIGGNVRVKGLLFCDLNRKDRSKEIVVVGPYGLEWSAYKIYAWRGGKIRTVLKEPVQVKRFNGDGTVTTYDNNSWFTVDLRYRLNRQGQLKLMLLKSYPLRTFGASEKTNPSPVMKNVYFYSSPNMQSSSFLVKKGSTVVFDRTNNKGWIGGLYKGRLGWVTLKQVEDDGTFALLQVG